ncbi:MAG: hypothetical protein QGH15_16280 [Kiritimatiellia bacterium]|jgi:hypothetical protein|nr:hypothetical protein [Kiritimatiellia bacterium]
MTEENKMDRRSFVKKSIGISAAAAAALTLEERILVAAQTTEPSEKSKAPAKQADRLPTGKIGDLEIGRMILGGNLVSGYSHSRDLVYVSSLMRKYNTEKKILDTMELCEQQGINAFLSNPTTHTRKMTSTYWKERGGKMKWIVDSRPKPEDIAGHMRPILDDGAAAIYVNGHWAEQWVKRGMMDKFAEFMEFARANKIPGGIGSHLLDVPIACEKAGIKPDFYMKTLHSRKYWSAEAAREHDNIWCRKPEETIAFMKNVSAPWIAYKTLAAGAISPSVGFKYALKNGADFLCVGMFDFQVKEDVAILNGILARGIERDRPWRA